MPKPNYQADKRKRDVQKKAKKEDKRLRKLEKPAAGSAETGESPPPDSAEL